MIQPPSFTTPGSSSSGNKHVNTSGVDQLSVDLSTVAPGYSSSKTASKSNPVFGGLWDTLPYANVPDWTKNVTYEPLELSSQEEPPAPTRSLSQEEIDKRAKLLFDRFNDDGIMWTGQLTDLSEVDAAFKDLNPADAQALIETYNRNYSHQWGRTDLLSELNVEFRPQDRLRVTQLLKPENVINQKYATSQSGDTPHIITNRPDGSLVPGSTVTYTFDPGKNNSGKTPTVNGFIINDPNTIENYRNKGILERFTPDVVEGFNTGRIDAKGAFSGTHLIVFEVKYEGEPAKYYTFEQVVKEADAVAKDAVLSVPSTPPQPDLLLNYWQAQIDELKQEECSVSNSEQVKKLEDIKQTIQEKLQKDAADQALPIKAVLVPTETGQPIGLNLYLKPLSNGHWAVVDLTNPDPHVARTYEGNSIQEAWDEYIKNNNLPSGQIAAIPPTKPANYKLNFDAPKDTVWNNASDGKSDLQSWSEALGAISTICSVAGVALAFVPGVDLIATPILEGVAGITGLASAALNMTDRVKYGNFQWDLQTAQDIFDGLASCAAVFGSVLKIGGKAFKISSTSLEKTIILTEIVDSGTSATSKIIISAQYIQQIQEIQNDSSLTSEEKQQKIHEIELQMLLNGGMLVLDLKKLKGSILNTKYEEALKEKGLSGGELHGKIKTSPILQDWLAAHGNDVEGLDQRLKVWKQIQGSNRFKTFEEYVASDEIRVLDSAEINKGLGRDKFYVPGYTGTDFEIVRQANIADKVPNFKTIDAIDPETRTIISYKTLDLGSDSYQPTYRGNQGLSHIRGTVNKYLNQLETFLTEEDTYSRSYNGNTVTVQRSDFDHRTLEIAVPMDKALPEQMQVLSELQAEANQCGIKLIITLAP